MSERTARATRKRVVGAPAAPPASPNGDAPVNVEPATPEQTPMTHPAVVVMRIPTDKPGQERIEMMEINGIDPLAVPTLLRMAANLKEKQINGEGR